MNYEVAKEKGARRKWTILIPLIVACIAGPISFVNIIIPNNTYKGAQSLMEAEQYEQAIEKLIELGEYKDSAELIKEAKYRQAQSLMEAGQYEQAIEKFIESGEYKDSAELIKEAKYRQAQSLMEAGQYEQAIKEFTELMEYKDSADGVIEAKYRQAQLLFEAGQYEQAIEAFAELGEYKDSSNRVVEATYFYALLLANDNQKKAAIYAFQSIGDYRDTKGQLSALYSSIYLDAISEIEKKEYKQAREYFSALPKNYEASSDYLVYIEVLEMFKESVYIYDQQCFQIADAYKKINEIKNDELREKLKKVEPIRIFELLEGVWNVQSKKYSHLHFTVTIKDGVLSSSDTNTMLDGFNEYVLVWDNGWYRLRRTTLIHSKRFEGKTSLSVYDLEKGRFTVYTDYGDYQFKRVVP